MPLAQESLVDLQEHCAHLGEAIAQLWHHDPVTVNRDGEVLEWGHAADWLDLAAGVCQLQVVTGRYDDTLMYCDLAREYENARSDLMSRLARELTIFSFAWNAFETIGKIVDPITIPPPERFHGANGLVDRVIYSLKSVTPFREYTDIVVLLRTRIAGHPDYAPLLQDLALPSHMGQSGIGIDFVRRVRNRFAHGAASLPFPDSCSAGWCGRRSGVPEVISLSTRIVLLTVQMLLKWYYSGRHFDLSFDVDVDYGCAVDADVHVVLERLHISTSEPNST